jgi:hypothetical protein
MPAAVSDVWTVADHLAGKSTAVVALYQAFIEVVEQCGPFTYSPTKTSITLKGQRRGFAGVTLKRQWISGYLDLQREVTDDRILNVAPYTKRLFVHHFRISSVDQIDQQFSGWMREAYAVGAGAHMRPAGG